MMAEKWAWTVGFHSRIERSLDADATRFVRGEHATPSTAALCPTNLYGRCWSLKFQTMTVASAPPETTCFMFGLNATALTPAV